MLGYSRCIAVIRAKPAVALGPATAGNAPVSIIVSVARRVSPPAVVSAATGRASPWTPEPPPKVWYAAPRVSLPATAAVALRAPSPAAAAGVVHPAIASRETCVVLPASRYAMASAARRASATEMAIVARVHLISAARSVAERLTSAATTFAASSTRHA